MSWRTWKPKIGWSPLVLLGCGGLLTLLIIVGVLVYRWGH